jgi:WD40 repeat protein/uncharacterized caspase-like protein
MSPVSVRTSRSTRSLATGEAKLWVLLVGVSQYTDPQLPNLAYPGLDCQELGAAITQATASFPAKSILLHHDLGALTPSQPPSSENVRTSLRTITQGAQPQDTVLFYFSGHGVLDLDTQQTYLCLAQTRKDQLAQTGLPVQALLEALANCTAHQQLVWLDACHSGGMSLRPGVGKQAGTEPLPNPTPQLVAVLRQRAAQSKGFYALLSCDQNQQSWEFPALEHGVFTYYLIQGLLGEAADPQGVIEADGLYKYVYYQTLRYIDQVNQQLRLVNQQKRGLGETQLASEYPLQTPKRIVEGVGELVLGLQSQPSACVYPRQALVVAGLTGSPAILSSSKILRGAGAFALTYFPQPTQAWTAVRAAIATCLNATGSGGNVTPKRGGTLATTLLYLRGSLEQTEAGDAHLVLPEGVAISRSWLRQMLRRSPLAQQVIILDCPGATTLAEWVEDLQSDRQSQCLIAAAPEPDNPEQFAEVVLATLTNADAQEGLAIASWIGQLQMQLTGMGISLYTWLSGTQGVIEVLPAEMGASSRAATADFDLGLCPYLGLRAFSPEDAPFFFGRAALTQQLLQVLSQRSFLAVVGASGSGKSSVVQAGLIAQLQQGQQIPQSQDWWIRSLRPGSQPLQALRQRLVDSGTAKEQHYQQLQLEGLFYQGVEGVVYWLRSRPEPMVVLVIDQFEELFTLAAADERQQFLDLVMGAVEHAGDRFKLVITLRSDLIGACLEYPALAKALQNSNILVPPTLNPEDYRQVILNPAEKVGLTVEPELVEVLLQELSHLSGDLPLLEFVLEQLWTHRQPGALTLQSYQQQIGGLQGVLERQAQALYDGLDPDAQACARWIFLALTQLGEGTEDTRRRVKKSALVVAKYPSELVERTLQILTAAKLVIVSLEEDLNQDLGAEDRGAIASKGIPAPGTGENQDSSPQPDSDPETLLRLLQQEVTVEVVHEILIRHWSTLRWWLAENRVRLQAQRQIGQAATEWFQGGQEPDFLLRGVRLDAAEELYVKYTDELSPDVQRFIEAGLEERGRDQQQVKRRLRQTQGALALMSALGIAAVGLAGVAYWQRQQTQLSEIQTLNALSESQLRSDLQLEALLTSIQAGKQLGQLPGFGLDSHTTAEVRAQTTATLQQAIATTQASNRLEGHTQRVTSLSFSSTGILASGSDDQTIRLWQPNGTLIRILKAPERVIDVAFSPDQTTLASASADGRVQLWQLVDGRLRLTLTVKQWVTSIAFSPDGQILAIASRDPQQTTGGRHTLALWNLATGKLLRTLSGHQGWVNRVRFSPDGKTLVSGGEDKTLCLWTVATGESIRILKGHQAPITDVTFSPDGQTLASASEDNTIKIWTLADARAKITLTGHTDRVTSIGFRGDGRVLVSASADRTLKLWDIKDDRLLQTLSGHGEAVLRVAFDPAGDTLVSAGADKQVRIWAVPSLDTPTAPVYAVSFRHDNQTFASAGWDGTIQLWHRDPKAKLLLKTLPGHKESPVFALRFSPDGKQLASAGADKTIQVWDVDSGTRQQKLTGHRGKINSLSFSGDGQVLASASDDHIIRLWQLKSGQLLRTLKGHQDAVSSIAFSPDHRLLASGSYDNTVKIWQLDGTLVQTLKGHGSAISSVQFSPEGQTVATASWDNTLKLWRVSDGTLLHTLMGHQDGVTSLAFHPNGQTLISGSADQTLKLWNPSNGTLLKTLLGHADSVHALSFSPDGQVLITASENEGVQVWDFTLVQLLEQGCDRLQNYLHSNSNVTATQQKLCRFD